MIKSPVVLGRARGRTIGSPTINLDVRRIPRDLPHGIYACIVHMSGKSLPAVVHFGPRPLFADTVSFEVHILDNLIARSPQKLLVEVIFFIRTVRNFKAVNELQQQIIRDIACARRAIEAHRNAGRNPA